MVPQERLELSISRRMKAVFSPLNYRGIWQRGWDSNPRLCGMSAKRNRSSTPRYIAFLSTISTNSEKGNWWTAQKPHSRNLQFQIYPRTTEDGTPRRIRTLTNRGPWPRALSVMLQAHIFKMQGLGQLSPYCTRRHLPVLRRVTSIPPTSLTFLSIRLSCARTTRGFHFIIRKIGLSVFEYSRFARYRFYVHSAIRTSGMAKTYYPLRLQPLWGTSLSLTSSPYPLKALFVAPLVGQVGLEPTTSSGNGFTVRGDTNYALLTHIYAPFQTHPVTPCLLT